MVILSTEGILWAAGALPREWTTLGIVLLGAGGGFVLCRLFEAIFHYSHTLPLEDRDTRIKELEHFVAEDEFRVEAGGGSVLFGESAGVDARGVALQCLVVDGLTVTNHSRSRKVVLDVWLLTDGHDMEYGRHPRPNLDQLPHPISLEPQASITGPITFLIPKNTTSSIDPRRPWEYAAGKSLKIVDRLSKKSIKVGFAEVMESLPEDEAG